MGSKIHGLLKFGKDFNGHAICDNGYEIKYGTGGALPYDFIAFSLAGCLYSTFLEIAEKKKLTLENTDIEVSGEKRDETPTTLKTVHVEFTLKGYDEEKKEQYEKSLELAAKYCSVNTTLQKVADVSYKIIFSE